MAIPARRSSEPFVSICRLMCPVLALALALAHGGYCKSQALSLKQVGRFEYRAWRVKNPKLTNFSFTATYYLQLMLLIFLIGALSQTEKQAASKQEPRYQRCQHSLTHSGGLQNSFKLCISKHKVDDSAYLPLLSPPLASTRQPCGKNSTTNSCIAAAAVRHRVFTRPTHDAPG